ncbi:DUF3389 domain-containing protein [Photobacterium atrarenae]|uniref:DUF3389 domain-containing protein n=1 Tax=Photobacterium atrarenae TaxID=865757 RepID=A0ABY5GNE8_9GAMM|nr:DUF3389 domain-containing protein [Photobacterium atrarenae]UTV30219.1 DUF3389 domain-containing protein [Photobacterium atrarenae]
MNSTFSQGRIIANQRELVIRIEGQGRVTLQAMVDDIRLLGGANVVTASGSGVNWSVCLDNEAQLAELAEATGIAVESC